MTSNDVFVTVIFFIIKFQYQNTFALYKKKDQSGSREVPISNRQEIYVLCTNVCYFIRVEFLKKHRSHSRYS